MDRRELRSKLVTTTLALLSQELRAPVQGVCSWNTDPEMEISRRDVFKWPLNVGCGAAGFLSALVVVPISWRHRWLGAICPSQMEDQMEDEVKILAKISKHMYSSDEVCTAGGWKLMKKKDKFAIFTRGTELLVAFQGTQLQGEGRWEDLKKDLFILFNMQEVTLSNCLEECFETLKEFPAQKDIIVTGHSLGGMFGIYDGGLGWEVQWRKEYPWPYLQPWSKLGHVKSACQPQPKVSWLFAGLGSPWQVDLCWLVCAKWDDRQIVRTIRLWIKTFEWLSPYRAVLFTGYHDLTRDVSDVRRLWHLRLDTITAHHVVGDMLSACWPYTKVIDYRGVVNNTHSMDNFVVWFRPLWRCAE